MKRAAATAVSDEHWIPLSDLMSGLMMVFMLLAVLFMLEVQEQSAEANASAEKMTQQAQKLSQQARQITGMAAAHSQMKDVVYKNLRHEFSADLANWGAEIDDDLTVRFNDPDVLFASGSADVSARFKLILADFFPRYIRTLDQGKVKSSISEIRLEGHTSAKWEGAATETDAYLNNMALSQARTRNVLAYLLALDWRDDTRPWIVSNLTANGLSSSKPIVDAGGNEDVARSQRVEFRVRTMQPGS